MSTTSHEPITPPNDPSEWWVNGLAEPQTEASPTNQYNEVVQPEPTATQPLAETTLPIITQAAPERKGHKGRTIAALSGVAVAAAAVVGVLVSKSGSHGHEASSVTKPTVAGSTPNPGGSQTTSPNTTPSATNSPSETTLPSTPAPETTPPVDLHFDYKSAKVVDAYPPVVPTFDTDNAGTAAFELLQDIRRYDVSGNAAYLNAGMPHDATPSATLDQTLLEKQNWQQSFGLVSPGDRQAVVANAFNKFYLRDTKVIGNNGNLFEVQVTTDEYNPVHLSENGTGMATVVRDVTLAQAANDTSGLIFYIRASEIVGSTIDPK